MGVCDDAGAGATEAEVLDPDAAEHELAVLGAHLDAATHRQLVLIRVIDESGHWHRQGALTCAHWLSWRVGMDLGAAREKVRVAHALAQLPHIGESLRKGEVSYSKVRAMTRVATRGNEAKLLEMAQHSTASQLERICRGVRRQEAADAKGEPTIERWLRIRHRGDPTVRLEGELLPDEAERVMEAVRRVQARLCEEHGPLVRPTLVDALVRIADAVLAGDLDGGEDDGTARDDTSDPARDEAEPNEHAAETSDAGPEVQGEPCAASADAAGDTDAGGPVVDVVAASDAGPVQRAASDTLATSARPNRKARTRMDGGYLADVLVHLTPDALAEGYTATMNDGRQISAETFRRLLCDCGLIGIVKDAKGNVLDVGRKTRRVPTAIRRAVIARDQQCTFPGCTHDRFLHFHHPDEWGLGGPTSVDNLCLLCPFHHKLVHEGGWRVDMIDGAPVFFRPDGKRVDAACPPPLAPNDPLAAFEAAQAALGIHDETGLTRWDGTPPDYHACVNVLSDDDEEHPRRREHGLDEEELERPATEWLREHGFA